MNENLRHYRSLFRYVRKARLLKKHLKILGFKKTKKKFLAIKRRDYKNPVMFEALHGFNNKKYPKSAEVKTAQIAYICGEFLKVPTVLALYPRSVCDLNRSKKARKSVEFKLEADLQEAGSQEYDRAIMKLVKKYKSIYKNGILLDDLLVVSIHGMADRENRHIDIGSGRGKLCSKKIAKWFYKEMKSRFKSLNYDYNIKLDFGFSGEAYPKRLRKNSRFGKRIHFLQIELNRQIRKEIPFELSCIISSILSDFNKKPWKKRGLLKKKVKRDHLKLRVNIIGENTILLKNNKKAKEIKKVYIDRSQRMRLKVRRGSLVILKERNGEEYVCEVHQASRINIGKKLVGVSKNDASEMKLKENSQIFLLKK